MPAESVSMLSVLRLTLDHILLFLEVKFGDENEENNYWKSPP